MAWFRKMSAAAVDYHEETVVGREDDFPGRALAYYGSRGETPLRWGDTAAARAFGLSGEVTPEGYWAAFGTGGFTDARTGERLVRTKIPGFEVVVSAHKTLAVLGVIGHAEDMHTILDAETKWTMRTLDAWIAASGGRRGKAAVPTPTTGLVYAVTRHGTSRAGDPAPHDHVLIANVCEMLDARGGPKALHSALVRDWAEAAAMVGRLHSAATAIGLGYAIEPDAGRSGRARDWRIAGIPQEVCDLYSKRRDEIDNYLDEHGYASTDSYRARNIAARASRAVKRHTGIDQLMPQWITELHQAGWSVEALAHALEDTRRQATGLAPRLTDHEIEALAVRLLDPEGEFTARWKVFTRSRLIAEVAPLLYGHEPAELDHVIDRIIASPLVVPLIGVGAIPERPYATAAVLATEDAIAERFEQLATTQGPTVPATLIHRAVRAKEAEIGGQLTPGQRATIQAVCGSGRSLEVIVGVAGAGKTTALDAASTALQDAGYQVVGTATSGQAARTLSQEAGIEARTMRSLLYRLDHNQLRLNDRTVVVLDEAGMTADTDLARLLLAAQRAQAKVVLVGDPRQLSPVGPGGALAAVMARHPEIVTTLTENKRQRDPEERQALASLRDGKVNAALRFYVDNDRIQPAGGRVEALAQATRAWAEDTTAGHDTLMVAWRRANVAALNRIARAHASRHGRIHGPELVAPGGAPYAAGDPIVLLQPTYGKGLGTSQRGTITGVDIGAQALTVATDDNRTVRLSGEEIDGEHLAHAYALTVHRVQGATCDRMHLFYDGGGPELGYVALSRARQHTAIHTPAENTEQAIDEISYDWSQSRADHWVSDTAQPEPGTSKDRTARSFDDTLAQARANIARAQAMLDAHDRRTASPDLDLGPTHPAPDRGLSL